MVRGMIETGIGADTKPFKQAVETGMIAPLEDAEKALDELGRNRSLDGLERDLEDAQDETKRLARETERTADAIDREYKRGYASMKNASEDATRKAGDGFDEVKDEAKQSAREAAASFTGEIDDVADYVQEVLANAFGGLGPVGEAAGIALALGLGAAFAAITNDAEAVKENVSTAFQEMAADGIDAWESAQSQMQRLTDAYDKHEDEINRIKDLTGLSFETVAAAWAGNKDAVDAVTAAYEGVKAGLRDIPGATVEATAATIAGWDGIMRPLNSVLEGYDKAKAKYEQLSAQQDVLAGAEQDRIQRGRDADQARYEAMAERYANPIKIKLEVDDSKVNSWRPPLIQIPTYFRTPTRWE